MSIERRRAHIEFLSKKRITITTLYGQKTFDLPDKKSCIVDLVKLEYVSDVHLDTCYIAPPASFFVYFLYEPFDDLHFGEINAQVKEGEWRAIGYSDFKDHRQKLFELNLWSEL